MALDNNLDQQVSSRSSVYTGFALVTYADTLTAVYTGRYRNFDLLLACYITLRKLYTFSGPHLFICEMRILV